MRLMYSVHSNPQDLRRKNELFIAVIRFSRSFLILMALATTAAPKAASPSRALIEQHLDRSIEIYGHYAAVKLPIQNGVQLWNPGAIRVSPRGEIFVANYVGEIYRLTDANNDGLEDTAVLFCNVTTDGLRYATTMAFHGDDLYVGTAQEIRMYSDTNGDGKADLSRTFLKVPCSDDPQDWTFGICFAPDGSMYVNLSTDSYNPNPVPDPAGWRGSVLRISPGASSVEQFATGLRFAPGMAFDTSGNLFFSDNEGGGNPTEEINLALSGKFYGHNPSKFPTHGSSTPPVTRLSTARGACNITFNSPSNDFGGAAGDLFVAFWGIGGLDADGAIARVTLTRQPDTSFRAREIAFCRLPKAYDLAFGPSGDLYATQFGSTPAPMTPSLTPTGAIYRFIPAPWFTPSHTQPPTHRLIRGNPARGKVLFAERACAQCHAMDGATELLGPNLVHLGASMDFESAYREISQPSHSIRSGYETETFETGDGDLISGRIISSDSSQVTLMVPGNRIVSLARSTIRSHHPSAISLMPEQLLANLRPAALYDLFAYLEVREQPQRVRIRHRVAAAALLLGVLFLTTWFLSKALNPQKAEHA